MNSNLLEIAKKNRTNRTFNVFVHLWIRAKIISIIWLLWSIRSLCYVHRLWRAIAGLHLTVVYINQHQPRHSIETSLFTLYTVALLIWWASKSKFWFNLFVCNMLRWLQCSQYRWLRWTWTTDCIRGYVDNKNQLSGLDLESFIKNDLTTRPYVHTYHQLRIIE